MRATGKSLKSGKLSEPIQIGLTPMDYLTRLAGRFLTSRRRQYAWLAGIMLWAGWLLSIGLGPGALDLAGRVVGTDYLEFYAAGTTVRIGESARLYDVAYQTQLQQAIIGPQLRHYYGFITPPFLAWLFAPLSALPYLWSFALWSALGLAALWLSLRLLALPDPRRAGLWALTFFPVFAAVSFGQNSLLSLLLLSLVYRLWRRGHGWAAGLTASLLLYKPQLLLGVALLWLLEWLWPAAEELPGGAAVPKGKKTQSTLSGAPPGFGGAESKGAGIPSDAPASFDCVRHTTPDSAQFSMPGATPRPMKSHCEERLLRRSNPTHGRDCFAQVARNDGANFSGQDASAGISRASLLALLGLSVGGGLLIALCFWQLPAASHAYLAFAATILPDLPAYQDFPLWNLHTVWGFWRLLLPGATIWADRLYWVCVVAGIGGFGYTWRRLRGRHALQFAAAICLTLWTTPHAMIYDWTLLLIPAALIWQALPERREDWRVIFAVVWIAAFVSGPLTQLQLKWLPAAIQISVPTLSAVMVSAWRWAIAVHGHRSSPFLS